jgi:hypothetical protein
MFLVNFFSFIDFEYNLIINRRVNSDDVQLSQDAILDQMIRANLVDSEQVKSHKKVTYQILASYLDLLKHQESLKQMPRREQI